MITTQLATIQDVGVIQDLAKKSWYAAYADILDPEQIRYMMDLMYSESALKEHFQNPNFHYYLIFSAQTPVGFVGFENGTEAQTTKLHRIYIIPEAKGKGAGKVGLQLTINAAKQFGDLRVILTVNKNNKAKVFYESQGFTVYDEAIFDIGNGYVMDDYLMERNV